MGNLFNITSKARELSLALESGELTEELENELVINQDQLQEKAINYGYVIRGFEMDIDSIDSELKRLKILKDAKQNAIDRMKESVLNAMEIYSISSVKSSTLNLSIRASKAVEITFAEMIPAEYLVQKITISPDKIKIKKAIESGITIDGAIIKENHSLQIK